jgi:hypothetical protein
MAVFLQMAPVLGKSGHHAEPVSPSTLLWAVLGLEAVYWYVQHCCLAAAVDSEHLHCKLWVGVLNRYLDAVFAPALAVAQASVDLCVKSWNCFHSIRLSHFSFGVLLLAAGL